MKALFLAYYTRFMAWVNQYKGSWKPSADFTAQASHVMLGVISVLFPVALIPNSLTAVWLSMTLVTTYFVVKEFTFDLFIEDDTVKDGIRDLKYFAFGLGPTFVLAAAVGRIF